jgi:hypothetical protein
MKFFNVTVILFALVFIGCGDAAVEDTAPPETREVTLLEWEIPAGLDYNETTTQHFTLNSPPEFVMSELHSVVLRVSGQATDGLYNLQILDSNEVIITQWAFENDRVYSANIFNETGHYIQVTGAGTWAPTTVTVIANVLK